MSSAFRAPARALPRRTPLALALALPFATLFAAPPALADDAVLTLQAVSVTGTREQQPLAETPASVGVVDATAVELVRPAHPSEIVSQVPGAAVAVTNGEGHTTAIRQPFTTAPVYLFLEDGIPTRSTGFFNHNALYETNLPQSGGIEITRGPGTALYGSDAIGGIVNVLTRTPPTEREAYVSGEAGGHGWWRLLAGGGMGYDMGGWRADLNLTHTDGWRDATDYDRQSGTLRWDHALSDRTVAKTVLAFSEIDQQTGAGSPLIRADYEDDPTRNYRTIAFREVSALRLSSAIEHESGDSLFSVTPYVRDNSMDLLATFRLAFDPTVYTTENRSFGLLAKWRQDFAPMRTRLIVGVDLDHSPGSRLERRLNLVTAGSGAAREYLDYSVGPVAYDYDVSFTGISPYVHTEFSPSEALRLTAGLRYDHLSYDFDNAFAAEARAVTTTTNGTPATRYYGQAGDGVTRFEHLSPKLGATWALSPRTSAHVGWTHGFRAPSESQLFRPSAGSSAAAAQASAESALGLDPVKADQLEVGLRGRVGPVDYDLVAYQLTKRDDILSYRDTATNATTVVNAGRTTHRGIELAAGLPLATDWRVDASLSWARHRYADWVVPGTADFSDKDIEAAPRFLGNTRLGWTPVDGARIQFEWVHVGSYWMDQANTTRYGGHDLFHLRADWRLSDSLRLFGNVTNLGDHRYADSAQISSSTPVYSPGLPRTLVAGVEARW
ncbi:MAG: TonB-dependent receptor [Rhodocyclaceae bacterium]|nr:TonB-dependent receptor [Rhodocyclaceae bacterium]